MPNPPNHKRHHHALRIIVGVLIVIVSIFAALIALAFVSQVFDRSERINQGNYSLETPATVPQNTQSAYTAEQQQLVEGVNNYYFGAETPQVTIVQFSDFACPFCLASYPALREIGVRHKADVRIIFRDWPGHEYSIKLAMAAYCAGEQGKFWEMHDKLFQNQSETFGSDNNQLAALATQLGVYNQQFQNCVDTEKYLPQIRANFADSQTLGVRGTPTWFINGQKSEGVLTVQALETMIEENK